jgi:ABC-type uncharacterized transport system fused permease/ATPase subunit
MTNNEELKKIALKVLSKSKVIKDENSGFALVTILMIISIMLTCIRILQECNKNKISKDLTAQDKYGFYQSEIHYYSQHRGWFTKMRIKKILRREMTTEDYEKYSLSIVSAFLEIGETLSMDDVQTLVEAANV